MAKADVLLPVNPRLLERRRSSLTDHIIRIRTAHIKRQFIPWWNMPEDQRFPAVSKSKENQIKAAQVDELKRRFKMMTAPEDSYEYSDSESSDKRNIKHSRSVSFEMGLNSAKKKKSRQPAVSRSGTKTGSGKLMKIRLKKSLEKESSEKPKKNTPKPKSTKNVNKIASGEKLTTKKLKRRFQTRKPPRNAKGATMTTLSQRKPVGNDSDLKKSPLSKQANLKNLVRPVTSKEIMVLKWLHELNCPETAKENARGNKLYPGKTKKYPIQILKGTLKPNAAQYINESIKSRSKDTRRKSHPVSPRKEILSFEKKGTQSEDNIEMKSKLSKDSRMHNKSYKSLSSLSSELSTKKSESKENAYLATEESKEIEVEEGMADRNSAVPHDVEMYVSELGKLQIVLDLKSFTPEDAAVIIWLNELPKSVLETDFRKRLSITSLKDMQPPEQSNVLKLRSTSVTHLEDIATPKPYIYFPPITILKNLAVDSKAGLRDLNKDSSSEVFYKRCNLKHIDSESS